MSCHHCCTPTPTPTHAKKRSGPIGLFVKGLIAYALVVFLGGTLAQTGNPMLEELGLLIRTVSFIDPAIGFVDGQGLGGVASGLRMVADGLALG